MMNKQAVSVVIPTYNNADYLADAIESVLAQTFRDIEIIVIDDGSTDQTGQVMSAYASRVVYLHQANHGPSAARNRGITQAQGKYLAFLDADDLYLPDKMSLQVSFLEAHPEIDLVYSDGVRFKMSKGKKTTLPLSTSGDVFILRSAPDQYVFHLMTRNIFPIHAALVKRECVVKVNGFDEMLTAFEDWDLWFRIAEQYRFTFVDGEVVSYRVTPGSNSSDATRNYHEARKVFLKIGQSSAFLDAPAHVLREYYYQLGLTDLALGIGKEAKAAFKKSLGFQPSNVYTRVAFILTSLLGCRAFLFYRFKRLLFGKRGMVQI
jgi:glycosyltransferase involved in cell wall biosynthesis